MKLSARERILLIILAIALIVAADYMLLISPTLDRMTQTQSRLAEAQNLKNEAEMVATQLKTMSANNQKLLEEINTNSVSFYPGIQQDRIILIVDSLIKTAGVESLSNDYSDISIEDVQPLAYTLEQKYYLQQLSDTYRLLDEVITAINSGTQVPKVELPSMTAAPPQPQQAQGDQPSNALESMTVSLPFRGAYADVLKLLKVIEGMNRTVVAEDLTLSAGEANTPMTGTLNLVFYALQKMDGGKEPDTYLEWNFNGTYGKENPFAP